MRKRYYKKKQFWGHTSILACSSALAPGAGIALTARSRDRAFFVPSTFDLQAALRLQLQTIIAGNIHGKEKYYAITKKLNK